MRHAVTITLAAVFAVPGAGHAQSGFEGVLSLRMGAATDGRQPMAATMWAKGKQARIEMTAGATPMTMLIDAAGRVLMLVPPQKMYYVASSSVERMQGANGKPLTISRLGRSETIAGSRCEWYRIGRQGDPAADVCVARGLGTLGADVNAGGGGGWSSESDLKALRAAFGDEFFPLRQLDASGQVIYEVTRVDKTSVPPERFAIPAGWREMSTGSPARPKS